MSSSPQNPPIPEVELVLVDEPDAKTLIFRLTHDLIPPRILEQSHYDQLPSSQQRPTGPSISAQRPHWYRDGLGSSL